MYVGHFGLAFAAKKAAPKTSLATLIAASEFLDILWPVLLTAGVEHVRIAPGITRMTPLDFYDYPISHSLLAVSAWGLFFGTIYFAVSRYTRGAVVTGLLVVSHWLLDALVHRPDLPLAMNGTTRIGLGLWNHPAWSLVLEAVLLLFGAFIYLRTTTPTDRIGTHALWPMLLLMFVTWLMNFFGPPPPSVTAIISVSFIMWIYVPWGMWIGRHRKLRKGAHQGVKLFTSHRAGI